MQCKISLFVKLVQHITDITCIKQKTIKSQKKSSMTMKNNFCAVIWQKSALASTVPVSIYSFKFFWTSLKTLKCIIFCFSDCNINIFCFSTWYLSASLIYETTILSYTKLSPNIQVLLFYAWYDLMLPYLIISDDTEKQIVLFVKLLSLNKSFKLILKLSFSVF